MAETSRKSPVLRLLVILAALVVIIAGVRAAASLFVPFLLALFLAILCMPSLHWLLRRGIPTGIGVVLITGTTVALCVVVATLMGSSLSDFQDKMKTTETRKGYDARLDELTNQVESWLAEHEIDVPRDAINAGKIMQFVGETLGQLARVLNYALLVLILFVFLLAEIASFPARIRAVMEDPGPTLERLNEISAKINRYMALKTATSAATGILAGVLLGLIGIDYPVLWGLVAFFLNYIPTIGSILAAVPPILLALIQPEATALEPTTRAIAVAVGFLIINVLIGSIIEPRFMGQGLNLATIVVFVSMVFWGWVLGPIGMLLSVPLTMALKIALESHEETRRIAVFLGSPPAEGA